MVNGAHFSTKETRTKIGMKINKIQPWVLLQLSIPLYIFPFVLSGLNLRFFFLIEKNQKIKTNIKMMRF